MIRCRTLWYGAALALVSAGCGSSPSSPSQAPEAGGTLVFSAPPLELSTIQAIVPLGNLNPPGHTIPTNHIYINNRAIGGPPAPAQPVFAPGDGTIQWLLQDSGDQKIGIRVGVFTYYLGHVVLDAGIAAGARVTAGQRLGVTNPVVYGIDLGVINETLTIPFLNPSRYTSESLHGDAPLKYFAEPLRSRMYGLVASIGDKDGTFHHDVRDRLAGNWFLDGLPVSMSESSLGWSQQLAFVFDNYDPSRIRVSIGGTLAMIGAYAVQAGAPDPREVTTSSGLITYRLLRPGPPGGSPEGQVGLLLVQMLEGDRIRAEANPTETLTAAAFTSAAREYVR